MSGWRSARRTALLGLGVTVLGLAGLPACRDEADPAWIQGYRVVQEFSHDSSAYCQGLVFDDGRLHESTGRNGTSSVRTVHLESGMLLRRNDLPPELFGEGLALAGERLFQLTWKSGVARVYDRATLELRESFHYDGEGWGLAFDGRHLIMSDGSEVLTFRDPATFATVRTVRVLAEGAPLTQLNELEVVGDELWANVWQRDSIARIDPRDGRVLGFVDLRGLFDARYIPDVDAVLNGIAYDPASKRLFVTGKLWPKLFEIEVVAK